MYLEHIKNLESLVVLQFTSIEETARCIYSGPVLTQDIEYSKIHRTESLPLGSTQSSGQCVLVNTYTTTSIYILSVIYKESPKAHSGRFYMQPLIGFHDTKDKNCAESNIVFFFFLPMKILFRRLIEISASSINQSFLFGFLFFPGTSTVLGCRNQIGIMYLASP